MTHMLVRHRVADFPTWRRVFDSHAAAQRAAGLHVRLVLRRRDDPAEVVLLFDVEDVDRAKGFVTSPDVPDAQSASGVVDRPDIVFLDEA
jgi:hypothetical protein